MELIQILIAVFALFALSRSLLRYRDSHINAREAIFWTVVWVLVIITAINPSTASLISNIFGVGRPIDLMVYLSIVVLFYAIFRIYVKLQFIESTITRLTRTIAKEDKRRKK